MPFYSSKYIDDDQALEDFHNYLGKPKNVNYKKTGMRVGRHKHMWKKNVCSIGLAAGFIEPLESTGFTCVEHSRPFNSMSSDSPTLSDFDILIISFA